MIDHREILWLDLLEKDDRTSPAEYPDMALITRDEFFAYLTDYEQRTGAQWRHRVRGSTYGERDRGLLQASRPELLVEGIEMLSYRGKDGRVWFRTVQEFEDGRFEGISE